MAEAIAASRCGIFSSAAVPLPLVLDDLFAN